MAAAASKQSPNQAAIARDLKHRVLTCLHKLSDRDTHSAAAAELESLAKTLTRESIPPFLSSIAATDSSDKSPVRKQCLRLISLLSEHHGNALSPHLSKLVSAVVRRLRDPDSAVRSTCVVATASISSHLTRPPSTSIMKPFIDALVTEQDQNAQIGAALCLAAAIDNSPDPEPTYLGKLLPRLEKLLKSDSFKAKPALLTLIGSVIGAGGASTQPAVRNLVPYLVEFVSSEDWTARKAAAEALMKLVEAARDCLSESKSSYLKTFEAKRFDKVKQVRETMNQMLEAWKEIPDLSDQISPSPEAQSSFKDDVSDGRYPPGSKTQTISSGVPQIRKKQILANRSFVTDGVVATAGKSIPQCSDRKRGPAMFRKLDYKKPTDRKIETAARHATSERAAPEEERVAEKVEGERYVKAETKRALFMKGSDETVHKFGVSKVGSRVVPFAEERSESNVVVNNKTEHLFRNHRECEDLSLIRKQLVQIQNQQSNLLDLLQRFIGSSQNGMHSLETRVHGLEMALDEISFDLAVSTGRMSKNDSTAVCCKLPGAEFLCSKLWRRTEGRYSTSRLYSSGSSALAAMHSVADKAGNTDTCKLENRRLQLQGGGGLIVNPLAEIHGEIHGISEVSSKRVSKNVGNAI